MWAPHCEDDGPEALPNGLSVDGVQMYKYNGVDTGAESLTAFAKEGYKGTAALNVPKEVSPLDIALKRLQGNVPLVSQPCLACSKSVRHSSGCSEGRVITLQTPHGNTLQMNLGSPSESGNIPISSWQKHPRFCSSR